MENHLASPLILLIAAQLTLYALGWAVCSMVVPEERAAALNWCLFGVLAGVGLLLIGLRTEDRGWWAYCGSNVFTTLSYLALLRGGESFVRLPPRNAEHLLVAAAIVAVFVLFGPSAEHAPARLLFLYGVSAALLVRTLLRLQAPIRTEFGAKVLWVVMPSGVLIATIFVGRVVQQAMHMDLPLELHRAGPDNTPTMVGYLVGAALFNFGFLSLLIMRLTRRLRELSRLDPLTGLLNRRALGLELEREWRRFRRDGTPLAVLAIDIDHFKAVNDNLGHAAGDAVLVAVAQQLRASARQTDVVARTGGEEFVLLMTGAQPQGAEEAAQRLREAIAGATVVFAGRGMAVTVSVGLALPEAADADASALMQRADKLLYRAKSEGRNRVCFDARQADIGSAPAA